MSDALAVTDAMPGVYWRCCEWCHGRDSCPGCDSCHAWGVLVMLPMRMVWGVGMLAISVLGKDWGTLHGVFLCAAGTCIGGGQMLPAY